MSDSTAQLETGQGVVTTLTDAYLAGRTDILAELARKQAPACSEVTRQLIERDAKGRAKYGTSLDRTDLDLQAWLQHMAEELLDAAGYALAAKREAVQQETWRPMRTAPRDGTMVRLLVEFDEHATEVDDPAATIGACNDDNVPDDQRTGWQFAGWCWTHDHFTEGKGTPVAWLPMHPDRPTVPPRPGSQS